MVYPCSVVVVGHNVQRSSPLKPLSQSKPNFMWSLLGMGGGGETKVCINGTGHITKMSDGHHMIVCEY